MQGKKSLGLKSRFQLVTISERDTGSLSYHTRLSITDKAKY